LKQRGDRSFQPYPDERRRAGGAFGQRPPVDALRRGASDIHVEPYEKELRIRFRIDGLLYDVMHPPLKMRDALISRIKIMSKLDISEKRLPQDGRIKIRVKVDSRSRELDFRVSTLPTLFGEKVVLRLLDKESSCST